MEKVRTKQLKVYEASGMSAHGPQIRMQGKWLQNAGFGVGTKYTVQILDGVLMLIAEGHEKGGYDHADQQESC